MTSDEGTTTYVNRPIGELVAEDYARAAVFTEAGIDFCCGGTRTLAEACDAAGTPVARIVEAMKAMDPAVGDASDSDPRVWPLSQLVGHIEDVHHAYLRRTLPVLEQWTDKIARVHGKSHPELLMVQTLFAELSEELTRHMSEEEDEVFPHLASLDSAYDGPAAGPPLPDSVIEALEDDHSAAGSLTRRIRDLTDGFSPPSDACTTYRATFALLSEFEQDLHRHVHLENNVLFPRARAAYADPGEGRG